MYCSSCGAKLEELAVSCNHCGAPIISVAQRVREEAKRNDEMGSMEKQPEVNVGGESGDGKETARYLLKAICAIVILFMLGRQWLGEGYTLLKLHELVEQNHMFFNHIFAQEHYNYDDYTEMAQNFSQFLEVCGYIILVGQVVFLLSIPLSRMDAVRKVQWIIADFTECVAVAFLAAQFGMQIYINSELGRELNSSLIFAAAPFVVLLVSGIQISLTARKR